MASELFHRTSRSTRAVESSLTSDSELLVLLNCAVSSNLRSSTAWNRSLPTLASSIRQATAPLNIPHINGAAQVAVPSTMMWLDLKHQIVLEKVEVRLSHVASEVSSLF